MACCMRANARQSGDPTNTLSIRQALIRELARRMRRIRGLVRTTVGYENDALNLSANAGPKEAFEFTTDQAKTQAFYTWLANVIREELLDAGPRQAIKQGDHFTAEFIRRAYEQGWTQAAGLLMQQGASIDRVGEGSGVDVVFNLPVPREQLKQLYTRTYEQLEGVSEDAAAVLRDELTRGLDKGENPRKIADRLTKELRTIEHTRLRTIARTEIINSHSTGALDRYERAGTDVVSHGEWATADDDRVCAICEALEGRSFTIGEMRDTDFEMDGVGFRVRLRPPAHPNGRCTIIPAVGVDPPETPLAERLPDSPAQQAANARVVA